MSAPVRRSEFCGQCNAIFYTTSNPILRCSRCGSLDWNQLKRYPIPKSLFDQEEDE